MQKILTVSSAKHFGLPSGDIRIGRFSGGEVSLTIKEDLTDADVFIVGSMNAPAENLVELLLAIDTSERIGAKSVTLIIPYFGYSRASREKFRGEAVSAEVMAKLLQSVGTKNFKTISLDIHSDNIAGFFNPPLENVSTLDLFVEKFGSFGDFTVVAPDEGASMRAREFAGKAGTSKVAIIQKERAEDRSISIKGITGDIGEKIILIDDIVDSGGTIVEACKFLEGKGAREIFVAVTHMVWQGGGFRKLSDLDIVKKIYTTDTVELPKEIPPKIEVISVTPILKKIIYG